MPGMSIFTARLTCIQSNKCNQRFVPCGHTFCNYCTDKLLLIANMCPMCDSLIGRACRYVCFSRLRVCSSFQMDLSLEINNTFTLKSIKDTRNLIAKLIPRPYKIISIIGKIPPKFAPILAGIARVPELSRDRQNLLRNFAFCSKWTGNRTCLYVEGKEDKKSIVLHYALDEQTFRVRTCHLNF